MRILIVLLFIFCYSCGSSKNTTQTEKQKEQSTKQIENEPKPETETIIEENYDDEVDEEDEPIIIPEPPKPPLVPKMSEDKISHERFNTILQSYVSKEGKVDYQGIKNNRTDLDVYIDYLTHNIPTSDWTKEEKLAYWINVYNALTIDLILENYPVNSIKDIKDPWKQRLWQFGDKWYNLDEIEHSIIRKMNEPRIHFALVCAAVSCPKLYNKAFTAETLDEDLTMLTREFLADATKNKISENEIRISKIFSWFTKDFKENGTLIDFLNKYTNIEISQNAKKRYMDYNWDLNE